MVMITLFEQIYSNTNKIYYHGSPKYFNDHHLRSHGRELIYLTNNEEYAAQYALRDIPTNGVHSGYIFEVKLTDKLNIYNEKSKKDSKALYNYLMNQYDEEEMQNKQAYEDKIIVMQMAMENGDWLNATDHSPWSRMTILKYIKKLGYDGFFNYEQHREGFGPAIGLFVEKELDKRKSLSLPHKKTKILRYRKVTQEGLRKEINYGPWKWLKELTQKQKEKLGYNKLFEQIYRSNKLYYHISPNKFSQFEKRNNFRGSNLEYGGTFLTPKLMMIQQYLRDYLMDKFKQDEYYVYVCTLNKSLNIFNPSSKVDRTKFLTEIRKDPQQFYFDFAMRQPGAVYGTLQSELNEIFRTHKWSQMENPEITKIVKKLGYDGYVSEENNVGNIFVFNPENIKIIKLYRTLTPFFKESGWTKEDLEEIDISKDKYARNNDNNRRLSFNKYELEDLNINKENFMIKQGDFELDITSITNKDGKMNLNLMYDYMDNADVRHPFEFQGQLFKNAGELEHYLIDTFGISDIKNIED